MPVTTTIFLPRAHRITKSFSRSPCRSASSWIRLLSSSVQRIAIVVFRFLMLSFLLSMRGFGVRPDKQGGRRNASCYACRLSRRSFAPSDCFYPLRIYSPHSLHVAREPRLCVQVVYLSVFGIGGKNGTFCALLYRHPRALYRHPETPMPSPAFLPSPASNKGK